MFVEVCTGMLQAGLALRFRATGESMSPTIREGETILVMPINPHEVRRGDVVLYRKKEKVIVHRVNAIEGAEAVGHAFILRGDAMESCDEPVEPRQICGKAVWVERGKRKIRLDNRRAKIRWTARSHAAFFIQWLKKHPGTSTLAELSF
jgi:signal peptidase I